MDLLCLKALVAVVFTPGIEQLPHITPSHNALLFQKGSVGKEARKGWKKERTERRGRKEDRRGHICH